MRHFPALFGFLLFLFVHGPDAWAMAPPEEEGNPQTAPQPENQIDSDSDPEFKPRSKPDHLKQSQPKGAGAVSVGTYEIQLLQEAIRVHRLLPHRNPVGKTIGKVYIYTAPVFSLNDPMPLWLNNLHSTTREEVVHRELLFQQGEPFSPDKIEETARNLRALHAFSTVVILPVFSEEGPEHVDLVVATRDRWSLRTSMEFSSTGLGRFDYFSFHVTEQNLLGMNHLASIRAGVSRDLFRVGQTFANRRLWGSRLALHETLDVFVNRETGSLEGASGYYQLARPLHSLDSRWGYGIALEHNTGITRLFQGYSQRAWSPPSSDDLDLPWEYERRVIEGQAWLTHARGQSLRRETSFATIISSRKHTATDAVGDRPAPEEFLADVVPRSEQAHLLSFRNRIFTPRFGRFIDLDLHGVIEDVPLGIDFSVLVSWASPILLSPARYLSGSASMAYRWALPGQGLLDTRLALGTRYDLPSDGFTDSLLRGSLKAFAPWTGPIRAVFHSFTEFRFDDGWNTQMSVGGDDSLRGYLPGSRWGSSKVGSSFELRTRPTVIDSLSVGAVAFADASDAFDHIDDLALRYSAGLGVRIGVPQVNRELLRFDIGIPIPIGGAETGFKGFFVFRLGQAF